MQATPVRDAKARELIRDYASRGLTKRETVAALRWGWQKFSRVLAEMDGVTWAPRNRMVTLRQYHESRRGHCPPSQAANAARARAGLRAKTNKTVRGFTGSIQEIIEHFGLATSVSSVRRRLAESGDLDAAFFTPNKPRVSGKAANSTWR